MNPSSSTIREATPKQLRYLRVLAEQTGTTFTSPESSSQASREIRRLTELKKARGRYAELPESEDASRDLVYGTSPQAEEIAGSMANCQWKTTRPATQTRGPKASTAGERTELARYPAGDEERVIYGQRVDGAVRVTDRPVGNHGRSYLIERGLEQDGYAALKALVADYVAQSKQLNAIPVASSAVRHAIEQEAA